MQNQLSFRLNMLTSSNNDMFDELTNAALIEEETEIENVLNKDTIEYRFLVKIKYGEEIGMIARRTGRLLDIIFRTNRFRDIWKKSSEYDMSYLGEIINHYITYNIPRKLHTPENVAKLIYVMNNVSRFNLKTLEIDSDKLKYDNTYSPFSIKTFERQNVYLSELFGCNYQGIYNYRSLPTLLRLNIFNETVMSLIIQGVLHFNEQQYNIYTLKDKDNEIIYSRLNNNIDPETLICWTFPPAGTLMSNEYFTWTHNVPKLFMSLTKKHLREHPEDFSVYRLYRIDFKYKVLFLGFLWNKRLQEGAFAALRILGNINEMDLLQ